MQFIYHTQAGDPNITIENELYAYLIKARRSIVADEIAFRNLVDDNLYIYVIDYIDKKKATLSLKSYSNESNKPKKYLHILWCIIDPKIVEKELPLLNQLGISKISFINCDYSQKNFKINIDRLNKILINSCGQCGRTNLIEFDFLATKDLKNIDFAVIDFSTLKIDSSIFDYDTFLVGPEGGFSGNERKSLSSRKIYGFDSDLILKSESAVSALSSIYLLS